MKRVAILCAFALFSALALSQPFSSRDEHWGMTQTEVIKAEKTRPVKRKTAALVYRDKAFGTPVQKIFEFTDGKLDAVVYLADAPEQTPDLLFLTWCLELTKRYGRGVVYSTKNQSGRPAWPSTKR